MTNQPASTQVVVCSRERVRLLLMIVGAWTALALILASAAGAASGSVPPRPAEPDEVAVNQYAKDFGTSQDVALSRLRTQGRGADLFDAQRAKLGGSFAGVWYDNEQGRFHVAVTAGGDRAAAKRVLADRDIEKETVVTEVAYTLGQLNEANAALAKDLAPWLASRLVIISNDVTSNSVNVAVSSEATDEQREAIEESAQKQPVRVVVTERPAAAFDVDSASCSYPNCTRALRGGVRITGPSNFCSLGYVAYAPSTGEKFAFTAGHCLPVAGNWTARRADGTIATIGPGIAATYGLAGDYGLVYVDQTAGWSGLLHSIIVLWNFDTTPFDTQYVMLDRARDYPGLFACRTGGTSPLSCGTVAATNVTITYSSGVTVGNLSQSSACAIGGDSGGPWVSSNYAYGLTSASTACGTGQQLYTMPIDIAESAYGVRIITNVTGSPK